MCEKWAVAIHHACPRVLSDERVSEDLCKFAGSERRVGFVPPQGSNTLLDGNKIPDVFGCISILIKTINYYY